MRGAGVPLKVVSDRLGQGTVATTADVYLEPVMDFGGPTRAFRGGRRVERPQDEANGRGRRRARRGHSGEYGNHGMFSPRERHHRGSALRKVHSRL